MAYQSVGKPRFFIDYLSYLESIGLVHSYKVYDWASNTLDGSKFYGLNPTEPSYIGITEAEHHIAFAVDFHEYLGKDLIESINYVGFLGHNLNLPPESDDELIISARVHLYNKDHPDAQIGNHSWRGSLSPHDIDNPYIINSEEVASQRSYTAFEKQGFSLFKVQTEGLEYEQEGLDESAKYDIDRLNMSLKCYDNNGDRQPYTGEWMINTWCMGHYYDMPHSPDLDVSMEIEYDGFDQIQTLGGSTLTRVNYHGSPKWGELNPWEVGDSEFDYNKRNGRRNWTLKFSYISQTDLFASNYMSNTTINPNSSITEYASGDLDHNNWGHVNIANNDFSAWTGDDPDSWRIIINESTTEHDETVNTYVDRVDSTDVAEMKNVASEFDHAIRMNPRVGNTHSILDVGCTYRWTAVIDSVTTGIGKVISSGYSFEFSSAGTWSDTFEAKGKEMSIVCGTNTANAEFTISNFTLEKLNPMDFEYTISNDDSIQAKLFNFVGNGQRFIFQADSNASNPSDFAICVLDQDSLKITQVANSVYNISMKVRECW